jgi:hypothetical protein
VGTGARPGVCRRTGGARAGRGVLGRGRRQRGVGLRGQRAGALGGACRGMSALLSTPRHSLSAYFSPSIPSNFLAFRSEVLVLKNAFVSPLVGLKGHSHRPLVEWSRSSGHGRHRLCHSIVRGMSVRIRAFRYSLLDSPFPPLSLSSISQLFLSFLFSLRFSSLTQTQSV